MSHPPLQGRRNDQAQLQRQVSQHGLREARVQPHEVLHKCTPGRSSHGSIDTTKQEHVAVARSIKDAGSPPARRQSPCKHTSIMNGNRDANSSNRGESMFRRPTERNSCRKTNSCW